MFFKKYNWHLLNFFFRNVYNLNFSKLSTIISLILSLFSLYLILHNLNSSFLKTCFFSLSFFFIIYWLISIFTYLTKKNQYGVYTRIIQRFWKRALWLFWLLELFLFVTYLFLAIISPQEVSYMLDNQQLFFNNTVDWKNYFINLLYVLSLILLTNVLLLNHKFNALNFSILLIIFAFLIKLLWDDVFQFYAINNHYNSFFWNHISLDQSTDTLNNASVWEQEIVELKTRTIIHYFFLLIFLKMWHTVFIFFFYTYTQLNSIYLQNNSFNLIAANLQNFYFLMFFNFILKFVFLKTYFNYLGSFVYYWFVLNNNYYDSLYFYYLFDLNMFLCL